MRPNRPDEYQHLWRTRWRRESLTQTFDKRAQQMAKTLPAGTSTVKAGLNGAIPPLEAEIKVKGS